MNRRRARGHRRRREGAGVRLQEFKQDVGALSFWVTSGALAVVLIGLAVALITRSDTTAAPATGTAPQSLEDAQRERNAVVTPGWNSPVNRLDFEQHLAGYEEVLGTTLPNRTVLYGLGIDACIELRLGRPDVLLADAGREQVPGTTWAIVNSALDVYCPDQQQHRYLVHR